MNSFLLISQHPPENPGGQVKESGAVATPPLKHRRLQGPS